MRRRLPQEANDRDDDALEGNVVCIDRLHRWVLRLQANASRLTEEALDGHFALAGCLVLDASDHDGAVGRRVATRTNHDDVTVADPRVDHALAVDGQRI